MSLKQLDNGQLAKLKLNDKLILYRQNNNQVEPVVVVKISNKSIWVSSPTTIKEIFIKTGKTNCMQWVLCNVIPNESFFNFYAKNSLLRNKHNNKLTELPHELPCGYSYLTNFSEYKVLSPKFMYFRNNNNHLIGVLCYIGIIKPSQSVDQASGISICSTLDNFNKKIGKQIALNRAMIALKTKKDSMPIRATERERVNEIVYEYKFKSFYDFNI